MGQNARHHFCKNGGGDPPAGSIAVLLKRFRLVNANQQDIARVIEREDAEKAGKTPVFGIALCADLVRGAGLAADLDTLHHCQPAGAACRIQRHEFAH